MVLLSFLAGLIYATYVLKIFDIGYDREWNPVLTLGLGFLPIIIFLQIIVSSCRADEVEVIAGSITEHFYTQGYHPEHKFNLGDHDRLIFNSVYGLRYNFTSPEWSSKRYLSLAGFYGENSVGLPMAGAMTSLGYNLFNRHLSLGIVLGAYWQNNKDYLATGGYPFQWLEADNGDALVPILGAEVGFSTGVGHDMALKLNTLITPLLTNTTLSLVFDLN